MTSESVTSEAHLTKFQDLLRELFQFDCADLDFGIYRIMNHKRDAIERFITVDLPARISDELGTSLLARQAQTVAALEDVRSEVVETLGAQALGPDGELIAFQDSNLGQKYLKAQADAQPGRGRQAVEADIYNRLYTFFSRYYQDGDFISRRRYGRNERYAIPYNGEEVYLHWANSDQYYVKTAEHFRNYDWTAPNGVSVRFLLEEADVEQNNVKGDKRFFVPLAEETTWDADSHVVTVPFVYRPLTPQESITYRKQKQQDEIIAEAVKEIPKQLGNSLEALDALTGVQRRNADGEPVTRLAHHLNRYTRRNDSDFFIHKDLGGFLSRELDFYLKNEVLSLDNLESAGEAAADGWFQQMRLIKSVGGAIIDFLAQIEDFQKMLWEKRKFVVDTQYCVTLGNIDPSFYQEIAENDTQWEDWRESLGISAADRSISFLGSQPTLPLDTHHFDSDFRDRLLASFDNIDGMTDGLLVHSENWQALNLLRAGYSGKVKCVYIDPPYNTGSGDFLYKDGYQHSSWLAMMNDRAILLKSLVEERGSIYCQIDHIETHRLRELFDKLFHFQREIIWDIQVLSGFKTLAPNWIRGHESILFYSVGNTYTFNKLRQPHTKQYEQMFNRTDENGRKFMVAHGKKRFWDDVKVKGKPIGDVWSDVMSFQQQPTAAERIDFSTQKPEKLLERVMLSCTGEGELVLDYFGGSGTTAACAQKLKRKYILCEMDKHFDDTILPRMKETLYGKSTSVSKTSGYKGGGAFKYMRLESYEDALDGIGFDEDAGLVDPKEHIDGYLLKYMLKWETKQSETLLNAAKLTQPFDYWLRAHAQGETRERAADVAETFNYLLGLSVRTRQVYEDDNTRYLVYRGEMREAPGRSVAVVWRNTEDWTEKDFARDREFVKAQGLTDADIIYVNGGSAVPGAKAIEPLFKERMFAGVAR